MAEGYIESKGTSLERIPLSFFQYLGRKVLERIQVLYAICEILFHSIASFLFRLRVGRGATLTVLLKQIYFTGFETVPIISWLALIVGLIIVTQSLSILPKIGEEMLIGEVMVWVVVRELGPLFSAVIVIARSGTAIASELSTMKLSGEITALEVMGIDPRHYLVMPRVIGTAISVFILTFYFEAISVLGGYLLAGFGKRISFHVYIFSIIGAMDFVEIGVSFLKGIIFGLIIGSVCTYHGLMVRESITQVPQQTTKAVIGSLGIVFVFNGIITFMFYM